MLARVTIILAVVAIPVTVCLALWYRSEDQWNMIRTEERMDALTQEFRRPGSLNGIGFSRIVGTGVVADVTLLSQEIWAHPRKPVTNYISKDAWGQVLHIKFTQRKTMTSDGLIGYDLMIWSNGRNRVNEHGYGDDLSRFSEIRCYAR